MGGGGNYARFHLVHLSFLPYHLWKIIITWTFPTYHLSFPMQVKNATFTVKHVHKTVQNSTIRYISNVFLYSVITFHVKFHVIVAKMRSREVIASHRININDVKGSVQIHSENIEHDYDKDTCTSTDFYSIYINIPLSNKSKMSLI